jgi:mitochondrial translocator assembly and maintenance protein 41
MNLLPANHHHHHHLARRLARCAQLSIRSLSTDTIPHPTSQPPPPPPPKSTRQSRLDPAPRRSEHGRIPFLTHLPPTFGRNQLLPVADSTRALFESIVAGFDAPVRYAFAYGSGVFDQAGYSSVHPPMIDFIFAVSHPAHWHSINMTQHPGHYPLYARALGSSFVSSVQDINPGLWFNAYIPMKGVVCMTLCGLYIRSCDH